jgi:DNA polymerase III subunit gamma/tau
MRIVWGFGILTFCRRSSFEILNFPFLDCHMEYTVLARRFRPQSFGEVIGQEIISQALRNAIASNRVAHAYLFTGARGVGKTSTARILAKSLNCPQAAGGDPCNQCEVCRGISVGSDVDVIEIDGASNRGIDEIRTLRANVNIKPMRCRYKIYIIDEVHMLTKEAFNALLKTLEEPPANVKFIFCTTDPQKVPETILSRCQRFDFGTIATATIGRRLTEIAAVEGVEVEPKAVQLVARRAAGSMRDSQSLFDQLLAFGGKVISAADVHRLLGTAPDDRLVDLGNALVERDRARVLELLEQGLQSGVQIGELTDQLLAYFRDLMVLACGAGEAHLISVDDEQRGALSKQAAAGGLHTILAALQILAESKNRMKGATFSRVLLELALVRIATLDQLDSVAELIAQLRQSKGGGGPSAPSLARTIPATSGAATPGSATRSSAEPLPNSKEAPRAEGRVPTPVRIDGGHPQGGSVMGMEIAPGGRERSGTIAAQIVAPATVAAPAKPATKIPFEAGREGDIWSQTLTLLPDMSRTNAKNVCRTAISGPNTLVLTFPKSYHFSKQYFERSTEQLGRIEKALERVVGHPIRVSLAVDESLSESPTQPTDIPVKAEHKVVDAGRDPLVQRAISVFGATVIRVESGTSHR